MVIFRRRELYNDARGLVPEARRSYHMPIGSTARWCIVGEAYIAGYMYEEYAANISRLQRSPAEAGLVCEIYLRTQRQERNRVKHLLLI